MDKKELTEYYFFLQEYIRSFMHQNYFSPFEYQDIDESSFSDLNEVDVKEQIRSLLNDFILELNSNSSHHVENILALLNENVTTENTDRITDIQILKEGRHFSIKDSPNYQKFINELEILKDNVLN